MIALSINLQTRRSRPSTGATLPLVLPAWPVLLLAIVLWGVTCCSGAGTGTNVSPPTPAASHAVDWLGRSRDDVVTALGRPLSALQRGDTEVLMYAKDVRFEIRDDAVVSYRAGSGPAIIAKGGTRYTATERGKVERLAPRADEVASADNVEMVKPAPSTPAPTPTTAAVPSADEDDQAESGDLDAAESTSWMRSPPELPDGTQHPMAEAAEDLAERGLLPFQEEDPEEPAWVRPTSEIIGALLRFGFAVLLLRIAISWVDLPCYMPDVCKVALLYVVVREGMHGLANLGGHWEWIELFRLDDVLSFFALCYLLVRFKVALAGITALKIAMMTKGVTYFLMLITGVVLSFTLG